MTQSRDTGPTVALGMEHAEAGRLDEAEALLRRALSAEPESTAARDLAARIAAAYKSRGVTQVGQGQWDGALASFLKAVQIDPAYADGHICVGNMRLMEGRFQEAEGCFRTALSLEPRSAMAHNNLGVVLERLDRPEEAMPWFRAALALNPRYADAHNNMGSALQSLGELEAAEIAYRTALDINPRFARAQCNLATTRLLQGDFAAGLELYENRFEGVDTNQIAVSRQVLAQLAGKDRWRGHGLAGRTLLVWQEQGLGDAIMMLRYLPLLKAKGAGRVMVSCDRALASLVRCVTGVDRVIMGGETLPLDEVDVQCPHMSLPHLFGTRLDSVPATIPYVSMPPEAAGRWARRLQDVPSPRVGLVWAGGKALRKDRLRSIPAERLGPLLSVPGVQFVSLQKGDEGAAARDGRLLDWMGECADLLETAALIQQLDLVIGADTAVVHLAGALGKPVWLLNRFESEWRWMHDRDDSPWYPTMRILRQPARHDWDSVITRAAAELATWARQGART